LPFPLSSAYCRKKKNSSEAPRTARHLLNRIINSTNGAQEVPQMKTKQKAAASLLQMPAMISSHSFW